MCLALIVPLLLINSLVYERQGYFNQAQLAVADGWGGAQRIGGPLLVVQEKDHPRGQWHTTDEKSELVVLPRELHTQVHLRHEVRHRGIFELPVYIADVKISGVFDRTHASGGEYDWSQAQVVLPFGDLQGLRELAVEIDDQVIEMRPVAPLASFNKALSTQPLSVAGEHLAVDIGFSLRGSRIFEALMPAVESSVTISGSWPHPGFKGRSLPDERTVEASGFTATWRSHELSQGLPRSWARDQTAQVLDTAGVMVELIEPVGVYRSVSRGAKYGLLFVAATFLTLLCFELTSDVRLHLLQYATTGFAVLMFFMLLLSLAEHVAFALAFVVSSAGVVALASWYVSQVTLSRRLGGVFASMLVSIYGVLYLLLRLEAYALLAGTFVVMIGVAALMWVTRRPTLELEEHLD